MTALAPLDATLECLRDATAHIATNLLDMERDPHRALLDGSALEGETAARWAAATGAIGSLWQWYTRLVALLDEATRLRTARARVSPRTERRLNALLHEPAIELDRKDVPVHERDLLASRTAITRCTADELLRLMTDAYDDVRNVLGAVALAWDDLVPRVADARRAFEQKRAAAELLDEQLTRRLEALRPRLDALANGLLSDPLSIDPAAVAALEQDLAALGDALLDAGDLRADLDDRLAAAHTLLDRARAASEAARVAFEAAAAKVASPTAHRPTALDDTLVRELDRVSEAVASAQWSAAASALAAWTARVEAAIARAEDEAAVHQALLEARNQLRGRLDAYLAKAHAVHLAEDDDAQRAYDAAHDVLYTAPTDLHRASALVEQYQRLVSQPAGRPR